MVPVEFYFVLACIMFLLGLFGALFRRNIIMVLMSIELMLNAVNLVFVAAGRSIGNVLPSDCACSDTANRLPSA